MKDFKSKSDVSIYKLAILFGKVFIYALDEESRAEYNICIS